MGKITKIHARQILDSRGTPTVMTSIELEDGTLDFGYVPSGASTGSREAIEIRDKDQKRYLGKGVKKVVETIREDFAKILVLGVFFYRAPPRPIIPMIKTLFGC